MFPCVLRCSSRQRRLCMVCLLCHDLSVKWRRKSSWARAAWSLSDKDTDWGPLNEALPAALSSRPSRHARGHEEWESSAAYWRVWPFPCPGLNWIVISNTVLTISKAILICCFNCSKLYSANSIRWITVPSCKHCLLRNDQSVADGQQKRPHRWKQENNSSVYLTGRVGNQQAIRWISCVRYYHETATFLSTCSLSVFALVGNCIYNWTEASDALCTALRR